MFQDDQVYIDQVLSGNPRAYKSLVDKHKNMVYHVAFNVLRNAEDAEEVAQDAFVKAFNSLKEFKGAAKFSTWIYRIVYNAAISKTRKKKIETTPLDFNRFSNYSEEEDLSDLYGLEPEERERILNTMLNSLEAEERMLITLYYYDDKSINEIAEIVDFTPANVKVRLFRIRNKMHGMLNSILNKENKKTVV